MIIVHLSRLRRDPHSETLQLARAFKCKRYGFRRVSQILKPKATDAPEQQHFSCTFHRRGRIATCRTSSAQLQEAAAAVVLADILSPKTCGISEIALRCRCCSCRPVPVAAHQTNELIDRLSGEQPVSGRGERPPRRRRRRRPPASTFRSFISTFRSFIERCSGREMKDRKADAKEGINKAPSCGAELEPGAHCSTYPQTR